MKKDIKELKFTLLLVQYILVLLLSILFCSCKKEEDHSSPGGLQEIFTQFWVKMNIQYVYWDKETTDWNSIYGQYKPIFDELSNSDHDKVKASLYLKEITSRFIDHHFKITFQEGVLAGMTINPAYDRKVKSDNFHDQFYYDDVVKSYLDNGFLSENGKIRENGKLINVTVGSIHKNLLYFHCNFFSLKRSYEANDGNKIRQVLDYFFSELKRTKSPFKGIILDLRNNMGGDIADLNFFAGKLVSQDVHFGYSRSKDGLGKLNYLPWLKSKLKRDSDYNGSIPIVLLGDNFTGSLSEIIIIALKSKRNLFIGEQTYGATGAVSDSDIFNSGSFSINNFLTVTTSSVEFKGVDGTFYEGIGIEPDKVAPFNFKGLSMGKDTQLEMAISHFK